MRLVTSRATEGSQNPKRFPLSRSKSGSFEISGEYSLHDRRLRKCFTEAAFGCDAKPFYSTLEGAVLELIKSDHDLMACFFRTTRTSKLK